MSSSIEPAERQPRAEWRKAALLLAVLVAYQIVLHWAVATDPGSGFGEFLTIAPLVAGLIWCLGRSRRGRLGLAAAAVVAVAGWIAWRAAGANPALVYVLPHVGAYLFMLWLFGHTLAPGRQALITRLATHVHGTLPEEIVRYTRQVTWAWCIFFAGIALTSALLAVFASLAVWSVFANLLCLPLVAAMFVAEYLYRILRFPNFSHVSIRTAIRAFQKYGKYGGPGATPGR